MAIGGQAGLPLIDLIIGEARDRQHRRRRRRLVAAALVLIAATALTVNRYVAGAASGSRGGDAAPATALPNPCSLLTTAQIENAFASHILTTTAHTTGTFARVPMCTWSGEPLALHFGTRTESVLLEITRESRSAFLADVRESRPPPVVTAGAGTVATWSEISQTLDAWQEGYRVVVSVHGSYATNPLARAKTLVRDAFVRL
jgi:hypothetical protein